jgi:hypothetical protein
VEKDIKKIKKFPEFLVDRYIDSIYVERMGNKEKRVKWKRMCIRERIGKNV